MYHFIFSSKISNPDATACVDGFFPCRLHLSHWPGNETPQELKADSSTEIIFTLLSHPDKDSFLKGITTVSNNHYDVDGVLAVFALMYPELALPLKDRCIAVARTGDFAEFIDEDALKSCIALYALENRLLSPFAGELTAHPDEAERVTLLYHKAFGMIPEILANPDAFEPLWKTEYAQFEQGNSSFEKRESVFSNYDDCRLSVLESVHELHPCVVNSWSKHQTVLVVQKISALEHKYQLFYKTIGWFDTGKPKVFARPGFESLAQELNLIDDRKNGIWKVTGTSPELQYDYRLEYVNAEGEAVASGLQVYEVENVVMDYLIQFS